MIYQTLQQETKARGARKIEIINWGLEPDDAEEMDLKSRRSRRRTNASRSPTTLWNGSSGCKPSALN